MLFTFILQEDNIKMAVKEIGWKSVDRICPA
jgi:hypothetical protein